MFASVLIANRGEIAVRIARTARRLGLRTIAVFSEADAAAPHVRACDEAIEIGPAPASQSYLDIDRVIWAARHAGAQCIHPGYGFLSENADFAEASARAGIVFVGPPPAAIRAMGLKDQAKALMEKAGVPVVPGYHGPRQEPDYLLDRAAAVGFPVLIKAAAGGGGKGLRLVERGSDFSDALDAAQRESQAAFGDARVLIEKYIDRPRHIEVQVFADTQGNVVHLNERDCSLQRRHQKVIEEAPAPGMTDALRAAMGEAAVDAARAVGYVGAGTVEFIAEGDGPLRAGGFWFLEMNTRLQVEHPVTEAITGYDLVEWQFRVAAGERLPVTQSEIFIHGHAVEARIYAEDPSRNFLPSSGTIVALSWPTGDGVRVDSGVEQGGEATSYYDPLLAKVIAHAPSRNAAFQRLSDALRRTVLLGPANNIAFLHTLCRDPDVLSGAVDTGLIARRQIGNEVGVVDMAAAGRGVAELLAQRWRRPTGLERGTSPWDETDGFQLSGTRRVVVPIVVDEQLSQAVATFSPAGPRVTVNGVEAAENATTALRNDAVFVMREGRQTVVRIRDFTTMDEEGAAAGGAIASPMHGRVVAVMVRPGDSVTKGQRLASVEAMKMEHSLVAPFDGVVTEVAVSPGDQIAERATVIRLARRDG